MGYATIWQFYILCFISITITNCDIKKEALGADNEIRVICSRYDEDAIRDFLTSIFSDTIYTPEPEPLNKLRFYRPESYNDLRRQAYLVVAAIGQDVTNPGVRLMKKLLSEISWTIILNTGKNTVQPRRDWRLPKPAMVLSKQEIHSRLRKCRNW